MIKKAIEIKTEVLEFLREEMKNHTDMFDDLQYTISYLLKKEEVLNNYYVILIDDKITDLIWFGKEYGVDVLSPLFLTDVDSTMQEIKKHFNHIVLITDYVNLEKHQLFDCNFKSSIYEDMEYDMRCYSQSYSVLSEEDVNILRDAIEKKFFSDVSLEDMSILHFDKDDYYNHLEELDYLMWTDKCNRSSIMGFHYLERNLNYNQKILLLEKDDILLGTIVYGIYSHLDDKSDMHYGLCFIDVNRHYRQKGLAKKLIEEFAKILPNDYPLVLSNESEMGKQCHMSKHFKDAQFKNKVFTSSEWDKFVLGM